MVQDRGSLSARLRSVSDGCDQSHPPILPGSEEILEHTTDCVVILDADWRFTYVNRRASQVLGAGEQLIGLAVHDIFQAERGTTAWRETREAAEQRRYTCFEFFASHLCVWFEVHVHPIESGVQIYFRDVTARREAEAALARREEALRLALYAVGDAAWDWNLSSGKLDIAGEQVETLGYGAVRYDASPSGLGSLIHRDDLDEVLIRLRRHLAGRSSSFSCQFRVRSRRGSWHWVMVRGRVIDRDPVTNWATRMVGTSIDLARLSKAARPGNKRERPPLVAHSSVPDEAERLHAARLELAEKRDLFRQAVVDIERYEVKLRARMGDNYLEPSTLTWARSELAAVEAQLAQL